MIDLLAQSAAQREALIHDLGQPAFRARQIEDWIFAKGVDAFDEMSNLPQPLRASLAQIATIGRASLATQRQSADGTHKRLLRLHDGRLVEAVLMPYADGRHTACISTQAGCAMGCVFCATGQMGLKRHLDQGEIFEQAWRFHAELLRVGKRLSNVVLMGMGEPFHNYEATVGAVRRIIEILGIGQRHITISTVGLAPAIRRFASENLQVTLAISLHAATDPERSALLPINRRWPLAELVAACRDYQAITRRRISFEWALIAGHNDTPRQAHALGRLLKGLSCHINLIPLNPTAAFAGSPTAQADTASFVAALAAHGLPATVRLRRGIDIDAGCGQLRERLIARKNLDPIDYNS